MLASQLALIGLDSGLSGDFWPASLSLFALAGLAWLLTYALHSTLLLGSAWLATRRMATARAGLRERVWKFAVVAAFATASLQVGLGFEPLGGRLALRGAPTAQPLSSGSFDASKLAMGEGAESASTPVPFAGLSTSETAPIWSALAAPDMLAGLLEKLSGSPAPADAAGAAKSAGTPIAAAPGLAESNGARDAALLPAAVAPWFTGFGQWTQWAFASCLLGACGGLLLFALLWVRLNGCLRDRVALEHGALAEKLRELCQRADLKRRVRLSVAPSLGAPISMGMFRAEICVPPRVLLELSEEEQEALLAHELAHVVRRDPLWLAACRLCEGVFFFQPLNRLARREIEDCAEFLSDAWAVRQTGLRFSLASCLTRIAEWIVGDRRSLPAPAMAQGRSRLRHRVELLLDESSDQELHRLPAWLGAACLGFGATLIAVVPCVSAGEALMDRGDGGGLPFLPERVADARAPIDVVDRVLESPGEPGEPAVAEVCELDALRAVPPAATDALHELQAELDALDGEIELLRNEAESLDLHGELAGEIAGKLQLLEMNLARLRELGARVDSLRQVAASAAPLGLRTESAASPKQAKLVQSAHTPTTTSTIFEELNQ